jgi:hypothetical protein
MALAGAGERLRLSRTFSYLPGWINCPHHAAVPNHETTTAVTVTTTSGDGEPADPPPPTFYQCGPGYHYEPGNGQCVANGPPPIG